MRLYGTIKIISALLLDFILIYSILGTLAAVMSVSCIVVYSWLGEYTAILKDRAVSLNNLNDLEKMRLLRAKEVLAKEVKEMSGADITGMKLHVIPSDNINAYAYGINNVAVTRGALSVCDGMTLNAVLAHEISHILHMDAVFHRIIFANITLMILGFIAVSMVTVSFMWIVFIFLCMFRICGNCISIFIFSWLSKAVKGFFNILQHIAIFIYQTVIGLISRRCEFRADRYSAVLGYGVQLSYFLNRFIEGQENQPKTLREILYDSHPAAYKRIQKIKQLTV